jgi:hypothetical protein
MPAEIKRIFFFIFQIPPEIPLKGFAFLSPFDKGGLRGIFIF